MTVGARTRFFTEFAEALHQLNSKPLHLIIGCRPENHAHG
jgi:hypothetical protein